MQNATEQHCSEQTSMQDIVNDSCEHLHFTMPEPAHSAALPPKANTARPQATADQEFQPTPEQVARSMARALRFQEASPDQALREQQIAEGRKMAQAEGFGKKQKPIDERTAQIRAGQSASAQERPARPQTEGFQTPAQGQAGAKKKRSRNRHKTQARTAPAMH